MFSYSKACATIEHITEADVPVLEALDQEELAWLLRVSARFDHMTAAKGLLAARASVNHITPHHSAGAYNALHEACRYNANVDMLLLMLQAKATPAWPSGFDHKNLRRLLFLPPSPCHPKCRRPARDL